MRPTYDTRFDGKWTRADQELVERLFLDGYSANKISSLSRGIYTRNSIMGWLHRKGIKRGVTPKSNLTSSSSRKKTKGHVWKQRHPSTRQERLRAKKKAGSKPFIVKERKVDLEPPSKKFRTKKLLKGCRYPFGDPKLEPKKFHYCGAPKQKDSSYCPYHHRLCHREVDI